MGECAFFYAGCHMVNRIPWVARLSHGWHFGRVFENTFEHVFGPAHRIEHDLRCMTQATTNQPALLFVFLLDLGQISIASRTFSTRPKSDYVPLPSIYLSDQFSASFFSFQH